MKKIFTLFFVVCTFIGCNSRKNEDSITYIRLHTRLLYDTIEVKQYLYVNRYAEYKFSNKDSLFIGVSDPNGFYNYDDNPYGIIDNEKPFHFGLEKFYTNKIDNDFSKLMTEIFNGEYKKSYIEAFGDGNIEFFVINRNGKQKFVFYNGYYEKHLLPEELRKADNLIKNQINLSTQEIDKPNYSLQTILNIQDSFFLERPPAPPPPPSVLRMINTIPLPIIDE